MFLPLISSLSFYSDIYLSSKTRNLGINLFFAEGKEMWDFLFISRSSMRQGRSICQLLIFPHSIYICILSFCDCHFTSPLDILLDKNGKLWPHWRQEEFGYRFPWKSNFKQWPGSLHRPVPRLSACRGPSPSSHSTFIFLLSSSRSSSEILIRISNRLERCEPWY